VKGALLREEIHTFILTHKKALSIQHSAFSHETFTLNQKTDSRSGRIATIAFLISFAPVASFAVNAFPDST